MGMFPDENDSADAAGDGRTGSSGVVPLLPLRDIVVFPHMVVPLFVGRARSIQALEDAMAGSRELMLSASLVVTQWWTLSASD